jgi:hypothetical protein
LLEWQRNRVDDALPQPGDDEQGDRQTLEDHHTHGGLPGHLAGELKGDHTVESEIGGQRKRISADAPINTVITAATSAVEVVIAEIGSDFPVMSFALDKINGFSTRM